MTPQQLATAASIHLLARCRDCRRQHPILGAPDTWLAMLAEWEVKHRGHRIEFTTPRRRVHRGLLDRWLYPTLDRYGRVPWWLTYQENTNFKLAYTGSADFTITLANLASSGTFVAGRESTAVSNATNRYEDYLVGGKITTGTTPTTAKTIRVYAHGAFHDTPTYHDVLDGTDSDETITSTDILAQLALLWTLGVDGTSDRAYPVTTKAISLAFGGVIPPAFGLYVAHDTVSALKNNAADHKLSHTGVYLTDA